jgi:type II secretory pathway pseudopilin PulG
MTGKYAIAMNKLKFSIAGILLAAVAIALVIQNQSQVKLRAENESLRQQLDQLARLQADNEHLSNNLVQATAAAAAQTTELMKLRGEVGMLRKQTGEITELQKKNQQLNAALTSSRSAQLAKPPPEPVPKINVPDNAAADATNGPDLGAVQLVNQTTSRFDLGGGKTCTLTPTIDADGNYDIKVVFESQKSDGQTEQTRGEIITAPGHAVRLNVGDNSIGFTATVNPAP